MPTTPLTTVALGDFPLQNGETILDCQLSYRSYGKLNADHSNVVIFPTWYMGKDLDVKQAGIIGPGKVFDTDRFHVIVINAFGNGLSSSPSNSQRQEGTQFPDFSIGDMVEAQHYLLSEKLGLEGVHLITGISMGGMQTFEWMMRYPSFAKHYLPIQGTPWLSAYNRILFQARIHILERVSNDPDSIQSAFRLLLDMDALTAWTSEHVNRNFPPHAIDALREEIASIAGEPTFEGLQDVQSQTRAFERFDIRQTLGDFETHLDGLKGISAMTIVAERDILVNPEPSITLANKMGIPCHVIGGDNGHMSFEPSSATTAGEIAQHIQLFLAS